MPKKAAAKMSLQMRIQRIDQMLTRNKWVGIVELMDALGCSEPTAKRDIFYMRNTMGLNIIYSNKERGYSYGVAKPDSRGVKVKAGGKSRRDWFRSSELEVIAEAMSGLSAVDADASSVFHNRLSGVVSGIGVAVDEVCPGLAKCLRVTDGQCRNADQDSFDVAARCISERVRMRFEYRWKNKVATFEVSPLAIVWRDGICMLDAWCHTKEKCRSYLIDEMRSAHAVAKTAKEMTYRKVELQPDFASGQGDDGDGKLRKAVLEVDSKIAPQVLRKVWCRDAACGKSEGGVVKITVPYADETAICAQIMSLGNRAKVCSPASLRQLTRKTLADALALYK